MTAQDTSSAAGALRGNLVIGAVTVAVGAVVIPYGASMPFIREGIPGPGLFPMMIGGLLVLFGALLALTSVLAARRERRHRDALAAAHAGEESVPAADAAAPAEGAAPEPAVISSVIDTDVGSDGPRRWVNGAILMGGIVFFVLFAEILGFPLTMALLVTAIVWSLRARWWVAVLTGAATSLALWAMFEQVLMVQLPDGILRGF
ncbi:tripartite tricarboxylate transporter TctB family protein [Brachybacterium sp. YJGR34]|uniref:tripartite tricarboxylate transporter TctB family protein n=1 Tax=Brachybacterium sp. YJGR34 TaxID=2059911 RepID=UPI000E0C465F|nr:tripartite tricarboxylate transporter TctB family protein [Brachybacterium sp. YJGR34]